MVAASSLDAGSDIRAKASPEIASQPMYHIAPMMNPNARPSFGDTM